jgi:hypothetical protein
MGQVTCPRCTSTFVIPGGAGRRCVFCGADLSGTVPPPELPPPEPTPAAPAPSSFPSAPAAPSTDTRDASGSRIITSSWKPPFFGGSTLAQAESPPSPPSYAPAPSAPAAPPRPPPPPVRREPVSANCPICGQLVKFELPGRTLKCDRCGSDLSEPERSGLVARIALPAAAAPGDPVEIPCPYCGSKLSVPADPVGPEVRCAPCQRALTPADLPIDTWVDLKAALEAGPQASNLIFLLRARWTLGSASAGEIFRHAESMSRIILWLRQPVPERDCDFPLSVALTADLLRHFLLAPDEARVESESDDRVVLSVTLPPPVPTVILTISEVPSGAKFGVASASDRAANAMAWAQALKGKIGAGAPRALSRFLAYRIVFGDWMKPRTMIAVPRAILERELRRLGASDERFTTIRERLQGGR